MIPLGILASSIRRTSVDPTPTPLPTVIGEAYGGGYYAGDIEYPDGQWYKLIVADVSADISGTESMWKTSGSTTAGTDSLTDGPGNTQAMINAGIDLHPAASHCINYIDAEGNNDYYFAAKDELRQLYDALGFYQPNCPHGFRLGEAQAFHQADGYWSSTQYDAREAWARRFSDGSELINGVKDIRINRVRPVRRIAFTPEAPALPTTIGEEFGGGYYIGDITIADGGADDGVYAVIMGGPESQATLAWKDPRSSTPGTDSNTNSMANTLAMQADDPVIHYAGMYCLGYEGGGFVDWCMPALHALNLAWDNRASLGVLAMGTGIYWASTQYSANGAWYQNFFDGSAANTSKANSFIVRPVRQLKRP